MMSLRGTTWLHYLGEEAHVNPGTGVTFFPANSTVEICNQGDGVSSLLTRLRPRAGFSSNVILKI